MPRTAQPRRTWDLRDFSVGLDLRSGSYSQTANRSRELLNAYVTTGKKLTRRQPLKQLTGAIDSDCQGSVYLNGQVYTLAPRGTSVTHTSDVATLVDTLYFDLPDYCTTWQLLDIDVMNGWVVAWIRHTFPGSNITSRDMFHVFDGAPDLPTFVEDPYVPTNLNPGFPLHVYGEGDTGAPQLASGYAPLHKTGVGKAWAPLPTGDVACSGVRGVGRDYNARVWNQWELTDLLQYGEMWYFVVPASGGPSFNFTAGVNPGDLADDRKYTAYVLEYFDASTKTWTRLRETGAAPTANATYYPTSKANPWGGSTAVLDLQVYWTSAADTVLRFRLIAGDPPAKILSGCEFSGSNDVNLIADGVASVYDTGIARADLANYVFTYDTTSISEGVEFTLSTDSDGTGLMNFASWSDTGDGATTVFDTTFLWAVWTGWNPSGEVEVYKNGTKLTSGYTASAYSGTLLRLTFTTAPAFLDVIEVRFVPVATRVITIARTEFGISAGKLSYQGETVDYPGAAFTPALSTEYLATVPAEFRSAVISKLTSPWELELPGHGWATGDVIQTTGAIVDTYTVTVVDADTVTLDGTSGGTGTFLVNAARVLVKTTGMPLNGEQRYTNRIIKRIITGGTSPVAVTNGTNGADYHYGFEETPSDGIFQSDWYVDKELELANTAGFGDATVVNTAGEDNSGEPVVAIGAIKNRMTFHTSQSTQLWQVDPDPSQMQFLDSLNIGVHGDVPIPVEFFGSLVAPTRSGFRSLSVVGFNSDSVQDRGIGDPIAPVGLLNQQGAVFWPETGQFVAAVENASSEFLFYVFSFSSQSKISAWSRYTFSGLSSVNRKGLIALNDRLYVFSGQNVFYLDASATEFRDYDEAAGAAYWSEVLFHLNDFGRPGLNKRLVAMDIVQDGTSEISFAYSPQNLGIEWSEIPTAGISYGRTRLPLALLCPAVAPAIRSRDETGWTLEQISVDFLYMKR